MYGASDLLRDNLESSILAKQQLLTASSTLASFEAATNAVVDAYKAGGRLYIAGNGGSAADAQHLAAEFVSKLAVDRGPLPAEAMTVDSSLLTAIGNDYGFDKLFSRQVEGKMRKGDVFLGITTTGRSPNIVRALESCRRLGFTSILFTGRDGGPAAGAADHVIIAPGVSTATIQEIHIVLAHTLCGCVEREMLRSKMI